MRRLRTFITVFALFWFALCVRTAVANAQANGAANGVANGAANSMFELPRGHFQLKPGWSEMCLDVLPNHQLRLTFRGPEDRNPVVIEGRYVVSATKMSDFNFRFTVETIRTKTLSKCRQFWIDEDLQLTERLETPIKPGSVLQFTAKFGCAKGRLSVQLCLHNAGKAGNKMICRDLFDDDKRCHEAPPVDGSLINRPNAPRTNPIDEPPPPKSE